MIDTDDTPRRAPRATYATMKDPQLCPVSAGSLIRFAVEHGWAADLQPPRIISTGTEIGTELIVVRLGLARPEIGLEPAWEFHIPWYGQEGQVLVRGAISGRVLHGTWTEVRSVNQVKSIIQDHPVAPWIGR